jgi:2-methylcitrate dehydratase
MERKRSGLHTATRRFDWCVAPQEQSGPFCRPTTPKSACDSSLLFSYPERGLQLHEVRVRHSGEFFPRENELAWRIAEVALDQVPIDPDVSEMVINRLVDDVAVAAAALNRPAPATARAQALAHPRAEGATVFGLPSEARFSAEWAAWANGTAVRELDFHDTFLAADYAHPGDNIPPLVAVAQQCRRSGRALLQAIVTAYEVQVNLTRGIDLHSHQIDHVAHLGPSVAAGLGTLLDLPLDVTYQAINQALHVSTATRQSRKGRISSWKAFAPAHVSKLAIEAVDRAMRGGDAPTPIYEGEDGVAARLLAGPQAVYLVPLPEPGEPKRAILDTFTKSHSAEYQAQALIDLAFRMRDRVRDIDRVQRIVVHTSDHTHRVIGTGSGDPEKFDPDATRETLDHSIMYMFAVALEDGRWHHIESFAPARAHRAGTVRLWRKIETIQEAGWTARYHHPNPAERAFGGRVEIFLAGGETVTDELAVAHAHPLGAAPFLRTDYFAKFAALTDGIFSDAERVRFLDVAERLPHLAPDETPGLTVTLKDALQTADDDGIF